MIRLWHHHRRAAAAGMILAAVLLLAAVTVLVRTAGEPSPPGGLSGIPVPSLSWTDCPDKDPGLQCATARVPRDYRNLGSGFLSLHLKRHRATDPTHRIGSLFVNPGGPGGSGADFVSAVVSKLPAEVTSRFDVVGFDPRGVADSGQVICLTAQERPVALTENGRDEAAIASPSDGEGEFGEGRREPMFRVGIRAEFVVAAAHVLDKSVSGANHPSRTQPFKATHRPQSSLEPPMICFDDVIAILLSEMAGSGHQLILWGSNIGLCA